MNWRNLIKNKCPQCGKELCFDKTALIFCDRCDFKISQDKMLRIINEKIRNNFIDTKTNEI